MQRHVPQPLKAVFENRGYAADRLGVQHEVMDDPQQPTPLGDQHVPVRQKRQRRRMPETRKRHHTEPLGAPPEDLGPR